MQPNQLLDYVQDLMNEEGYTADDVFKVGVGMLNSLILSAIDEIGIDKLKNENDEAAKVSLIAYTEQIVEKLRRQFYSLGYIYISKDAEFAKKLRKDAQELNREDADVIDETYSKVFNILGLNKDKN